MTQTESLQLQEKKDKCLRLKSLLESIKTDPAGILSLNPHSLQITRPEDQAPPPVNHAVALPSPTGTKQTAPAGQSSPTQKSSLPIPAPNSEPIQINTSRPVQHENKFNPSHKLFLHQLLLERRPISQSMLEDAKYAVMTNDWMISGRERQTFAFLQEFETAKKKELCLSSYQPKRAKEPSRSKFAWDYVLDEMKWMALDYREERKWKIAMAYLISHEAANYCKSGRQAVTASIPLFHGCSSKDPSADYAPLQQEKYIDPIKAFPIVPLSQISQTRFASPLPKPEIAPLLPGMQTYSGSLDQQQQSLLFNSPVFELKSSLAPANNAPPQPKSISVRPPVMWTSEEDEMLLKLSPHYQFNWAIISECMNQNVNQIAPRKIPWDCFARWQHLQSKPSPNLFKSRKDDLKRRAMRHMHFFDGIAKIIKKRESQRKPTTVKSSQKPSLTAHLSHQAIASRAGVDPKKWRTPLEHNERRIKIQANVQQRVQGMILQQPTGSPQQPQQPNGRVPVRPPQGLFSGAGVGVSSSMSSGAGSQSGANRPVGQPVAMPGATAAGVARLPTGGPAAAMASMTPAQVQQFIQRQAMVRQGQAAGSPQTLPQGPLTPAQMAQMPPALAQRMFLARQQQQALMQQQQQQQQQRPPTPVTAGVAQQRPSMPATVAPQQQQTPVSADKKVQPAAAKKMAESAVKPPSEGPTSAETSPKTSAAKKRSRKSRGGE